MQLQQSVDEHAARFRMLCARRQPDFVHRQQQWLRVLAVVGAVLTTQQFALRSLHNLASFKRFSSAASTIQLCVRECGACVLPAVEMFCKACPAPDCCSWRFRFVRMRRVRRVRQLLEDADVVGVFLNLLRHWRRYRRRKV